MIRKSIKENCITSIIEFFECEELIYGFPWDNKSKNSFINNQLEKRIFLYQFLENKLFKKIKKQNDNKSLKILEIGPSEGIIARMLRNDGYEISILEYEKYGKSTVPISKDFYPNIKTSFCEFDKEKFPYKSNTFDIVISFGVIEHIEPPTFHFWSEMNRILKFGGHLFLDNPNPHNLRKRITGAFGLDSNLLDNLDYYKQENYFTGHYREHSEKELIYCIKDNMKLIDSGYFPFAKFAYCAEASLRKKIILFFYNSVCRIFRSTLDTVYVIGQKK